MIHLPRGLQDRPGGQREGADVAPLEVDETAPARGILQRGHQVVLADRDHLFDRPLPLAQQIGRLAGPGVGDGHPDDPATGCVGIREQHELVSEGADHHPLGVPITEEHDRIPDDGLLGRGQGPDLKTAGGIGAGEGLHDEPAPVVSDPELDEEAWIFQREGGLPTTASSASWNQVRSGYPARWFSVSVRCWSTHAATSGAWASSSQR